MRKAATAIARQAHDLARRPHDLNGHTVVLQTTLCVAVAPFDADNARELIRKSDVALDHAKGRGRGATFSLTKRWTKTFTIDEAWRWISQLR